MGIVAGIAALFVREHAGLYCVICLALAVHQRNWRQAAAWSAGILAYAIYFGWHAWIVSGLIGADELAQHQGWVQLAGAPFVIAASQMNCLLLLLPQWVTALFLPLAMLGFIGWRTPFRPVRGAGGCGLSHRLRHRGAALQSILGHAHRAPACPRIRPDSRHTRRPVAVRKMDAKSRTRTGRLTGR